MYSYRLFRQFYIIKNSPQALRSAAPRAPAPPVRMIVRHCRASARKQSFPAGRHAFRSRGTSALVAASNARGPASQCDQRPVPSSQAPVASLKHWPFGHWNSALHISLQKSASGVPHIDGQLEPQSVQTCPPQSSPWAQAGGAAGSASQVEPNADSSCQTARRIKTRHDAQQKQTNESAAAEVWLRLAPATDRRRPRPSRL